MLRVLGGMRAFLDALGELNEEQLFACGADILRLAVDLYRRTGQPFLLSLMESLRSRLPDVSGLMHMFPFQREYRPETGAHTPDEEAYYARMQRFATGKGTADALAMTALIAQYSGSGPRRRGGQGGADRAFPLPRHAKRRVLGRSVSGRARPGPRGGTARGLRPGGGVF